MENEIIDAGKAPVLSPLEALIKKVHPNYKEIVSLVLDGGSSYTIFLNAGHGSVNPAVFAQLMQQGKASEIYKEYETYKNGDGKMFQHVQIINRKKQLYPHPTIPGALAEFNVDGWLLEGMENRAYINALVEELKVYVLAKLVNVVVVSHEWKDTNRLERIRLANGIHAAQKRINPKARSFWVGWHFNASPNHNANGICIFTSKGQTHSDKVAEVVLNNFIKLGFPLFNREAAAAGVPQVATIRTERVDGDKDLEKDFDEVAKTDMPALLGEFGFGDEIEDAKRIHYDPQYKRICLKSVVDALVADAKGTVK